MTVFLIILHVLVCIFLILFVLLQPGARGGVGAAFGGAGGATVFGGRGANTFLAKLTAAAAVIFMLTSISLSFFASHNTSVMRQRAGAKPAATDAAAAAAGDAAKADAPKADAPKADAPKADGSDAKAPAAEGAAAPAGEAPAAPTP